MSDDCVALIIGDTGLIGGALARMLHDARWQVLGVSRGNACEAGRWRHWSLDVSREIDLATLAAKLRTIGAKLDLVAFAIGGECDFEDFAAAQSELRLHEVISLALAAPLMALHAVLPFMSTESLAIFYSGGGALAAPKDGWNVSYAAAKAGLHRAVESLALQLRPHEIWPVIVDPGWVPGAHDRRDIKNGTGGQQDLNMSHLRDPEDAACAVMALFEHGGEGIAGRLISVVRDYQLDLTGTHADSAPDFLRLRLVG